MRPSLSKAVAVVVLVMGVACGGGHHGGGGGSSSPTRPPSTPPPGSGTERAVVANDATGPVGLTWYIGFNDNVSRAALEAWYARMVALNANLWDVTEGQVYLAKVIISDNVAPGYAASTLASGSAPPAVNALDMTVFVGATWDEAGAGGFVMLDVGREGRIIGLPDDAFDLAIIHESSHMVFRLTWAPGPLLWDEYIDGPQDDCIMETTTTLRWCAADNHVAQSSQPTSCWQQILTDYPNFRYAGANTATTAAPAVAVEYNDAP